MVEKIIIKSTINKTQFQIDLQPILSEAGLKPSNLSPLLRMVVNLFICTLIYLSLFPKTPAQAFDKPIEKNYFASLRSSETNVRAGPGSQYPIKFTFKLRGLPVKVISEYDNWNEIKDYEGDTGWVSQNLITKKRTVLVKTGKSFVNLYAKPSEKSKVVLRLENDVAGDFIKCGLEYCGIKVVGKKGWISKKEIWGVDEEDIVK